MLAVGRPQALRRRIEVEWLHAERVLDARRDLGRTQLAARADDSRRDAQATAARFGVTSWNSIHRTADFNLETRDIATALSKGLDLPLISVAPDKAAEHFGWFANFAAIDVQVSSAKTQAELGWTPTGPGLIADLEMGHYFGK